MDHASAHQCPYCGSPLRWVPLRWFGRGCFECDRCGDFPDLSDTGRDQLKLPLYYPPPLPAPRPKHSTRPRVLLVDDSAEHCDLYALMLEPAASVVTASRGDDALAIAATERLDAIVLDVLMPGMDGWEVCRRLKENEGTRPIPVIMLTSLDGPEVMVHAQNLGAAAVLTKPCPAERLAVAIEQAVRPS